MPNETMREEYDFSKAVKNPYFNKTKASVTIRLDQNTIDYFKKLSQEVGRPYQTLINSFLSDCAERGLRPKTTWQ